MLVLSRKQKQQIKIGDDVVITVLQIKGGSVRLGIEAPREIHVMRGELEEFREPAPKQATGKSAATANENSVANPAREFAESTTDVTSENHGTPEFAGSASGTDNGNIFELKIHGSVEDGVVAPTRLSEIVESVVRS